MVLFFVELSKNIKDTQKLKKKHTEKHTWKALITSKENQE